MKLLKSLTTSILISSLLITLSGCGEKPVEVKQEVKNVHVVAVKSDSISSSVEYSSRLKPVEEVSIASKIPGKVESVLADVGQEVTKGQILFTLDKKDAEAQYRQSQAALSSARANMTRAEDSSLSQQVTQAETAVRQYQVQYDDAVQFHGRIKSLFDAGAASRQDMDNADLKMKNAQIQLENAKANLKLLQEKAGPQSVDVAAAQVTQAQATVNASSVQLDNSKIASPISGIVSVRSVDEGEIASSAAPSFTIINDKTVIAEVNVPDKTIVKIQKGQTVPVKINAMDDKTFNGVIDTISPSADSRTQLYTVKIKIDNADRLLKAGMFARISFPLDKKENVLVIPNQAIILENGVQYVYTATGNIVKKLPITTGISNEKLVEVTGGLKQEDFIITEGQIFLNDGEKVNMVK